MQNLQWSDGPTMEHMRYDHACTTISGNKDLTGGVIVVGGQCKDDSVEILEFGSNRWKTVGKSPLANLHGHTVILASSPEYILYSVGGMIVYSDCVKGIYGLTHSYTWTLVGNLTNARACHTSLNLKQNEIPRC